jgi:hypothetical protein
MACIRCSGIGAKLRRGASRISIVAASPTMPPMEQRSLDSPAEHNCAAVRACVRNASLFARGIQWAAPGCLTRPTPLHDANVYAFEKPRFSPGRFIRRRMPFRQREARKAHSTRFPISSALALPIRQLAVWSIEAAEAQIPRRPIQGINRQREDSGRLPQIHPH